MTIIGFNQAIEYNTHMTNTLQHEIEIDGRFEIFEENKISQTMTELVYAHPNDTTRYAYIVEIGGMGESPGQKSIISDKRLSYNEAHDAILKAENQ